jgi:hypothetical protein
MDVVKTRDTKIEESNLNTLNLQSKDTGNPASSSASVRDTSARRATQELPGLRHETKDVLKQLHANINYLEDLGSRLGFVLSDVRTLIRR